MVLYQQSQTFHQTFPSQDECISLFRTLVAKGPFVVSFYAQELPGYWLTWDLKVIKLALSHLPFGAIIFFFLPATSPWECWHSWTQFGNHSIEHSLFQLLVDQSLPTFGQYSVYIDSIFISAAVNVKTNTARLSGMVSRVWDSSKLPATSVYKHPQIKLIPLAQFVKNTQHLYDK